MYSCHALFSLCIGFAKTESEEAINVCASVFVFVFAFVFVVYLHMCVFVTEFLCAGIGLTGAGS